MDSNETLSTFWFCFVVFFFFRFDGFFFFFFGGGGGVCEMEICINILKCEWFNIEHCFNILSTECISFFQNRHFIYKILEEGRWKFHQFMFVYRNTIKDYLYSGGPRAPPPFHTQASVTIMADFSPEFNPPFRWRCKHQTKINNLVSSEFPNRSNRSARSYISTFNCI